MHSTYHQQFCEYFALLIEEFLVAENINLQEFYHSIRSDHHKTRRISRSSFATVLNSIVSFESFCSMMNDIREGRGAVFCPELIDASDDEGVCMQSDSKANNDSSFGYISGEYKDIKKSNDGAKYHK